jgi:hypothetical protein
VRTPWHLRLRSFLCTWYRKSCFGTGGTTGAFAASSDKDA